MYVTVTSSHPSPGTPSTKDTAAFFPLTLILVKRGDVATWRHRDGITHSSCLLYGVFPDLFSFPLTQVEMVVPTNVFAWDGSSAKLDLAYVDSFHS